MTTTDLIALAPFLLVAAAAVAILLAITLRRDHLLVMTIASSGLLLALGGCALGMTFPPRSLAGLLSFDRFSLLYCLLILSAGLLVTSFSYSYLDRQSLHREEYYLLIMTASLGAAVLAASTHVVSFFLGLETLSISLYTLIAYLRTNSRGIEAGIKYLILAAVASAFILFGTAFVYAGTGSLSFGAIASRAAQGPPHLLLNAGIGMLLVGIGFKLALVPFHLWAADVYEGAPAPVAAFIATASKGAVFAVLLRFAGILDLRPGSALVPLLAALAVASMFAGNLLALLQQNVKRLLAYSSIAHAGYLLVALVAGGPDGRTAATIAVAVYMLATLGAFGVVTVLSEPGRDADSRDDYQGLAWRRPWLAAVLTAMLLSLAGIPLTAGFIGKFYLISSGAGSSLWSLVGALIINSVIGLFYYLRVVMMLFGEPGRTVPVPLRVTVLHGGALGLVAALLAWTGLSPGPLIDIVATAVQSLR
jgi:NADH-quinone oxidoreductase subunit N